MHNHFIYGALARYDVLSIVLGTADMQVQHTSLPGYGLPDNPEPLALASPLKGATLDGILLTDLNETQTKRLSFVLAAMGGVVVEAASGVSVCITAQPCFSRQDHVPLDLIEREAIREIMGYFGRIDPRTIAQRKAMILARAAARAAAATPKPSNLRSGTGAVRIHEHASTAEHEGFFLTRSYQLQHPRFDGTTSPVLTREAFVATDAAIVLPYDPVRDRVLLVEQFRMGAYGRGDAKPWMLEPVAGRVDAGETPETCARRECLEEAGLELRELIPISSHYCSPGCSTEYFHLYLGLCDLPDERPTHGGLETEHEDIALHLISYDAAQALLETGEADNGPLVLSLLWLSKTRAKLRASA
jgi:nudix-type nucleoside diphosphatase (YffH/AdpP family)